MKLFFYTTLLLVIPFFTFSCKAQQNQVIKEHYRSVNKHSTLENKLLRDNNELLLGKSTPKNNDQDYNNFINIQLDQSQVNTDEFKVIYDDSEIANGDVYREAAAHRQKLIDRANNKDCNCNSTAIKTTVSINTAATPAHTANIETKANQATASSNAKSPTKESYVPEFFAELTDTNQKLIRKVGVSHVDEKDKSLLKQYSLIIASFTQSDKMEPLKKALTSSTDKLFFLKNDAGMYYAILGSYNTENEAQQKLKRIWMEYTNLYTAEELNNKYGISFTDLYILKR